MSDPIYIPPTRAETFWFQVAVLQPDIFEKTLAEHPDPVVIFIGEMLASMGDDQPDNNK